VIFSLTKLYSFSASISTPSIDGGAPSPLSGPEDATFAIHGGNKAHTEINWQDMFSAESMLEKEIGLLEKQKEVLALNVEELKLMHEKKSRQRAIEQAESMILIAQRKPQTAGVVPPQVSRDEKQNGGDRMDQPREQAWCKQAAAQFSIVPSTRGDHRWGTMSDPTYREAWTSHECDRFFLGADQPPPPSTQTQSTKSTRPTNDGDLMQSMVAQVTTNLTSNAFVYLNDNSGRPRRRVTVGQKQVRFPNISKSPNPFINRFSSGTKFAAFWIGCALTS
jgi:hypothetical protein